MLRACLHGGGEALIGEGHPTYHVNMIKIK